MHIKSNQEIVTELVAEYKKIKTNLTLVLNQTEWNAVSDILDLIVIGDNPGKDEKKLNSYLRGGAGKRGRKFIEYALKNLNLSNFLILNKTPFYSDTTAKLKEDANGSVEQSIIITLNKLKLLIDNNPKLIVLVFGISGEVNEIFFTRLSDFITDTDKEKLFYLSHPSHGHLDAELMSKLYDYLLKDMPINLLHIIHDIKQQKINVLKKKYDVNL